MALAPDLEAELLELLASASWTTLSRVDGRVRWALDADDVVCLLELGGKHRADVDTLNYLATMLGGQES